MSNRRFPLLGTGLTIPWEVAERAYETYARHGISQSLERLAERGGMSPEEMNQLYPTWREHKERIDSTVAILRAYARDLEAELAQLREALEKAVGWCVSDWTRRGLLDVAEQQIEWLREARTALGRSR